MDASVIEGIINFIMGLSAQYPKLTSIFAILYTVGIVFKIGFSAVSQFVAQSPSKKDDDLLLKMEENKAFKAVKFIADLLIRFKIK
jgi:hypothetical protein